MAPVKDFWRELDQEIADARKAALVSLTDICRSALTTTAEKTKAAKVILEALVQLGAKQ